MNQEQDKKPGCWDLLSMNLAVSFIGAQIGSIIGFRAAYPSLHRSLLASATPIYGLEVLGVYVVLAVYFVVGLFVGLFLGTIVASDLPYGFGLGTYLANRFGNGIEAVSRTRHHGNVDCVRMIRTFK